MYIKYVNMYVDLYICLYNIIVGCNIIMFVIISGFRFLSQVQIQGTT